MIIQITDNVSIHIRPTIITDNDVNTIIGAEAIINNDNDDLISSSFIEHVRTKLSNYGYENTSLYDINYKDNNYDILSLSIELYNEIIQSKDKK